MAQEESTDDFRPDQLPGVTTLPTVTWPPGREVPGQSGPSKDSQDSAVQHPFPYLLQAPGFMGELPRGLPPKAPYIRSPNTPRTSYVMHTAHHVHLHVPDSAGVQGRLPPFIQ